jgi:hypothetical protein
MKIASRVLKVLSLLTALAACGRSQSNTSTGATLQGMVASSTAAAQGLRVGVDSASLTTTTDAGGHFLLAQLPAGDVTLHITGPSVDAAIQLSGLRSGENMTILVRVSGSSASVDGKKELKFHGTIESIDLTKKILKISGRTVAVDGQTEIENGKAKIALADLKAGETVKVAGTLQLDDSVLAREIKVLAPEAADDDENEAEFVGTIKSLAADTKSLEVTRGTETVTVNTDAHTAFERSDVRIAFGDLHVGDLVKVEGTRQSATVVLSTEIEVLPPHAERIEFKGTITDVNTAKHTLTVGAHTVVVGPDTKCEGQVVSCDALQKGDVVEVAGKLNSDGTVQAHEINKTAPPPP